MKQDTIDYLKADITSMEEGLCEIDAEDEDLKEDLERYAQVIEAVRTGISCATIPQYADKARISTETLQMLRDAIRDEVERQVDDIRDMNIRELIDDRGQTAELAFHLREAMRAIETIIEERGEKA